MQPGVPEPARDTAAPPALRAGTPVPTDLDEPPSAARIAPAEREPDAARIAPAERARGLTVALRAYRARRPPRDSADGPTLARMFGQFGIFGLSVFAIIIVLLLPCVIGIVILAHR